MSDDLVVRVLFVGLENLREIEILVDGLHRGNLFLVITTVAILKSSRDILICVFYCIQHACSNNMFPP